MSEQLPVIVPWRRIPFDPLDGGSWIVAGDVDGDGEVEIITARNIDVNDVHYTCTVAAYKLDGTRLWRWGGPGAGRAQLHHDVACQVYDWDGDGRLEVIVCDERVLVELDGTTGVEKRRLPLPSQASDCLVFCNLSGGPRATDVLVKNRYAQIWAYDREWQLLWTRENPGGHTTAHQPLPIDLDGDGRDSIMAGLEMLNPDGSTRWAIQSGAVCLEAGHLDCCRVLRRGVRLEDWRLALTYCWGDMLVVIDGTGKQIWALTGEHFESIDVGRPRPDLPGQQILVDLDKAGWGASQLWVINCDGERLASTTLNDTRHHRLLDWTGTGAESIVVGVDHALLDGHSRRIANLEVNPYDQAMAVHVGDMTGNGAPDILLGTRYGTAAYIYHNEAAVAPATPLPFGTGTNVTLY